MFFINVGKIRSKDKLYFPPIDVRETGQRKGPGIFKRDNRMGLIHYTQMQLMSELSLTGTLGGLRAEPKEYFKTTGKQRIKDWLRSIMEPLLDSGN